MSALCLSLTHAMAIVCSACLIPSGTVGRCRWRISRPVTALFIVLVAFGAASADAQSFIGPVKITFSEVGAGTVLSQCVGGGTLPNCTGGQVQNVYPGLTFYSQASGFSGSVSGRVVVISVPTTPAALVGTGNAPPSPPNAACAESAGGGPDCRARLFIKFAPGVTRMAYTVVGGYERRPNTFFPDDFGAVMNYGPSGLQLQSFFARMFFVWNRFVDFRPSPFGNSITNILGFELFTTTGDQALFGLAGMGGIALDDIQFLPPGPPCADTNGNVLVDDDEDGLCDNWEAQGVDFDGDGIVDLHLNSKIDHKDLFVEFDYMDCASPGTVQPCSTPHNNHAPSTTTLNAVKAAFAAAPVANPDGVQGITLHIDATAAESIPHVPFIDLSTGGGFDALKLGTDPLCARDGYFGTKAERDAPFPECQKKLRARWLVYRYLLFGHQKHMDPIVDPLARSSGQGEIGGNDFMVTLGSPHWSTFTTQLAQTFNTSATFEMFDLESGTLMHELGHTLNLDHGGFEALNCKPNYLSVMNYSRQLNSEGFNWFPPTFTGARIRLGRALDFSRSTEPNLNEAILDETLGLRPAGTVLPIYYGAALIGLSSGPVDWDGDRVITSGSIPVPALNGLAQCKTNAVPNPAQTFETFVGFNDWTNIQLNFRSSTHFADGVARTRLPEAEMTVADAARFTLGSDDVDNDTVVNDTDNCPFLANPTQLDSNGNGIGDACEGTPPINAAPIVNAGTDQSVTLPNQASLNGTVTDDGLPSNTLVLAWTLQTGPGTVSFGDSTQALTTATFSAPGAYVLRLTADDGGLVGSDDVTITVDGANGAPTANAGPDQTVEATSSQGAQVTLNGLASSDPDNDTLTYEWSGPFGKLSTPIVSPVLPLGTTIVTLTVDDGHSGARSDTVSVTVRDSTAPTVTPPANISVIATEAGGTRGSASAALATFLLAGTAVDIVDAAPVRLTPEASGTPVSNTTLFPIGQTTVTFRFRDVAQNVGTASATVTVTAGPLPPTCAVDVTTSVSISNKGSFKLNRATGVFVQQVKVTNNGSIALSGPLAIVISGLDNQVAVVNASGTTSCIAPSGDPFVLIELDDAILAIGETVNVVLQFRTRAAQQIVYVARVVSGSDR
jgi:hypothetical protein